MKAYLSVILLVASAAACAPSAPQHGPAPRRAQLDADVPPILALLSDRERLSLTSQQVIALDSIAREWDVNNVKLNRRLGVARGKRPVTLALNPAASPTRAALADNNRRAAEAVQQVLTPAQREAACAMPRATGTRASSRNGGVKASFAGRGTARHDARPAAVRPAWHWCAATAPAQPLATL
ncbi:MAG TPA: hypothetical protein VF710_09915 [Longimicrobium sp.]